MPELPEVETTRRGLKPLISGKFIENVQIRERRLRWPVSPALSEGLQDQQVVGLGRRGKYLLIAVQRGTLVVHLGMSGSLFYLPAATAPAPHDHVDIRFTDGSCLRFNDPRRFGSIQLARRPERHRLLRDLGPEPLGAQFTADYLLDACRNRRVAIKQHLMNGRIVAGLGNIYATEALFRAAIHPGRAAGRISRRRIAALVDGIRSVLSDAIEQGGTTLRDFVGGDGRPGYFQLSLAAYDRGGDPCVNCGTPIKHRVHGQRSSYYCPRCQR